MAQDEGRVGRISRPRRGWAPGPLRPRCPVPGVREYTYVYAAVAPSLGLLTSLVLPRADTAMMNCFLEHVSHPLADFFIIMQVDQAGWHRCKDLVIPENIRLISQPAYSPEVNPVEHVWEELREKDFPNRLFSSLDQVVEVLCNGINDLTAAPDRLQSMTFFLHFSVGF